MNAGRLMHAPIVPVRHVPFWRLPSRLARGQTGGMTGMRIFGGVLAACLVGGLALAFVGGQVPAQAIATPVVKVAVVPPKPVVAPPSPKPAPVETGYVIKRVLDIKGPMRQGDHYWDESGAPARGPVVVTVDLQAQTVSVFRAGYEIGTAVIVYGSDRTPTPTGVFPITQKDANHVSNIYGAPMPYMLRMTTDGISIHGSKVGNGWVTHGCVGVPTAFAKKIFGVVRLGDKVIVTNGERLATGQKITAA